MAIYNQNEQKDTFYACTVYTMLNIIKYDFGVELSINWILKIVMYMERIGALLPKGAYFAIIYPAMVKLIEMRTGFKLEVKEGFISKGIKDGHMWGLGLKKGSKTYKKLTQDGRMTFRDVDDSIDESKTYGHNHAWKFKNHKGVLVETAGGYFYSFPYNVLRYAEQEGMYYDKVRTLIAGDDKTREMQKVLIAEAKGKGGFISYEEFKILKNKHGY